MEQTARCQIAIELFCLDTLKQLYLIFGRDENTSAVKYILFSVQLVWIWTINHMQHEGLFGCGTLSTKHMKQKHLKEHDSLVY